MWRQVSGLSLPSVVYDEGTYHPRHPGAEGEEEDNKHGPAPLVDDGQRREDDAEYYTPDRHCYIRFAINEFMNFSGSIVRLFKCSIVRLF
jgi:hypothetical protein